MGIVLLSIGCLGTGRTLPTFAEGRSRLLGMVPEDSKHIPIRPPSERSSETLRVVTHFLPADAVISLLTGSISESRRISYGLVVMYLFLGMCDD